MMTRSYLPLATAGRAAVWLILWLAAGAGATSVRAQDVRQSPNILLMMADDMGLGDTSSYQDWTGNPAAVQVKTPAMERLARMGIRFTDAHSASSRCTATRQALLTGRYTWRTRLKYSVLWGPQGDPLIEPGRPTLATLLRDQGYRTGMSGKWHCGLTYRNSRGEPESNYELVDLTRGIADGPLDHGFDFFHGTSRSHPTSDLQGWLDGARVPAAIGGTQVDRAQYVLTETGPVNYAKAKQFLSSHLADSDTRLQPFFLYYACHANHTTHDPCEQLDGRQVRGASHPGGKRSDFIYENDVALGLLLDYLQTTEDPRRPGQRLVDNTLIIFTSDNGAERARKTATGPLRSHKGSIYEGGHRVPFIAAWKLGNVGDGDAATPGQSSDFPICHVDLFGTFAELTGAGLPADAAEDTFSILAALRGDPPDSRPAIFHNDHSEGAKLAGKPANSPEAAWLAIRLDNPTVQGETFAGRWKLLVDHQLLMAGVAQPRELYELTGDLQEQHNRIDEPALQPLVAHLTEQLRATLVPDDSQAAANYPFPLWDEEQEIAVAEELPMLDCVTFHVIKKWDQPADGYTFLHGVGLAWHRGRLYASIGHNRGAENTVQEEAQYRVSDDFGKSWSELRLIDDGSEANLAVSHGVFLSHADRLWAFHGAYYNKMERIHTRAYSLDEASGNWTQHGVVIEHGFWPMNQPVLMPDGNWIMPGFSAGPYSNERAFPAAVAISHGDDLTQWDYVEIPIGSGIQRMWGESAIWVAGQRVINIARYGGEALALAAVSEDGGRSWSPSRISNLPMATSKPAAGLLSTGQRFLICTTAKNQGGQRSPLTIAVSRPGEDVLSKIFVIRRSLNPGHPGESAERLSLSYPCAIEHNGSLYVGFSNNGGRRGNLNSAEMAVIPIQQLATGSRK